MRVFTEEKLTAPSMYEAHRRFRMKVLKAHDRNQTTMAYEECLRVLRLINRADPITELLAKQIIEVAQTGVRDPPNNCALTLEAIPKLFENGFQQPGEFELKLGVSG